MVEQLVVDLINRKTLNISIGTFQNHYSHPIFTHLFLYKSTKRSLIHKRQRKSNEVLSKFSKTIELLGMCYILCMELDPKLD